MASKIAKNTVQNHTFHQSYLGIKNGRTDNDIDWLKFNVSYFERGTWIIKLDQNETDLIPMKISIFDTSNRMLKDKVFTTAKSISLKTDYLTKGTYFIFEIDIQALDFFL